MAATLLQRFQGSIVGGVIGDCVGAVYEEMWGSFIGLEKVLGLIRKLQTAGDRSTDDGNTAPRKKAREKLVLHFTDDTAMARSVASSLIANNELNARDMAKRFTEEYFKEPNRGYGGGVVTVFKLLSEADCLDTFGPAKRQFDGKGSYGNGGAMRISPAALFVNRKSYGFSKLKEIVETITRITHSHTQAIQGAILQCYAVELALRIQKLDTDDFVDELIDKIKPLEEESAKLQTESESTEDNQDSASAKDKTADVEGQGDEEKTNCDKEKCDSKYDRDTMPYCWKLEKVREYAKQDVAPSIEEITENLGTGIAALDAVPAAVYSFLRSAKPVEGLQDRGGYERTIIYSISLGGDTDTIATMAGAMAGAYYGIDAMPPYLLEACEGVQDAFLFAEQLYNLTVEVEK